MLNLTTNWFVISDFLYKRWVMEPPCLKWDSHNWIFIQLSPNSRIITLWKTKVTYLPSATRHQKMKADWREYNFNSMIKLNPPSFKLMQQVESMKVRRYLLTPHEPFVMFQCVFPMASTSKEWGFSTMSSKQSSTILGILNLKAYGCSTRQSQRTKLLLVSKPVLMTTLQELTMN